MQYAGFSYLVYECKAHVKERGERNNDLPIHDEREPSMSINLFFSCFYSADNFDVGRDSSIARGLCLNTRCGLSIYAVCFSPLPRSSSSSKKSAFVHLSYVVHTASYDQCVFATTREQRSNEVCAVIKHSWISNFRSQQFTSITCCLFGSAPNWRNVRLRQNIHSGGGKRIYLRPQSPLLLSFCLLDCCCCLGIFFARFEIRQLC